MRKNRGREMKFNLLLLCFAMLASTNIYAKTIIIKGSSTVYPISEAVAEEYGKIHRQARVSISVGGTGSGFNALIHNKTDIVNASRAIETSEIKATKQNGVEYVGFAIAYDAIVIAVNKKNTWISQITVDQLHKIWASGSKVLNWKQVDSSLPDSKLSLYSPGTASGTFDYFTHAVNGQSGLIRTDSTRNEDANVLVRGVEGNTGAMGYFGYAYYVNNTNKLRALAVVNNQGKAVFPSQKNALNGTYNPLTRPLFIYVNVKKLRESKEVQNFVKFYFAKAKDLAQEVGYFPLTPKEKEKNIATLRNILKN